MTDLCTQAETYLAIERELESRVADWAQRLREVGMEPSEPAMFEYMRDALFCEARLGADTPEAFDACVEALESQSPNQKPGAEGDGQ